MSCVEYLNACCLRHLFLVTVPGDKYQTLFLKLHQRPPAQELQQVKRTFANISFTFRYNLQFILTSQKSGHQLNSLDPLKE